MAAALRGVFRSNGEAAMFFFSLLCVVASRASAFLLRASSLLCWPVFQALRCIVAVVYGAHGEMS